MSKWRDLRYEIEEYEDDHYESGSGVEDQNLMLTCIRELRVGQFKNLISRGVDPNFCDRFGETPLHVAASQTPSTELREILELLIYFGAPVERQDRDGLIPLHNACRNSADSVRLLLDAGSCVNCTDNAGRTALMLACCCNSPEALIIVQYLLDRAANVAHMDTEGETALHYVCSNMSGQEDAIRNEIVYKLMHARINVNHLDHQGHTAMCNEIMILVLKDAGPGQTPPDNTPSTHTQHQRYLVFKTLLRGGGTINFRNIKFASMFQNQLTRRNRTENCERLFQIAEPLLDLRFKKYLLDKLSNRENLGPLDQYDKQLIDRVKHSVKTVRCLKSICRGIIRRELRGKVMPHVGMLNVPRFLEDYLTFSDTV